MSKKHKRSTKFQALADSLRATRARLGRSCNASAPIADSRALWDSAPIVLKHFELRCEVIEVTPGHRQPLMFMKAIDRLNGLIHFEIHKRTSLPTVEAFLRRAEAAFASGLLNYYFRVGLRIPAAVRPASKIMPTANAGPTLVIGYRGAGKSHVVSKLIERFPRLDHE